VSEGLRYLWSVHRAGVPRLSGYVATRALGKDQLEAVVLERVGGDGKVVPGTAREIGCDILALNYGFTANAELAAMAGAQLRYDEVGGGWVAVADEFGRTSIEGLFVAGDCAGLRGALIAEIEGRLVGAAVASTDLNDGKIRTELRDVWDRRRQHQSFQTAVRATLRLPPALWNLVSDDTIVCRCENVIFSEIRAAFGGGHVTPNAVKRNVRPGMGWCAGRTCLRAIGALAELHTGVAQTEAMTARPMVRPVSFAALSNQKRASS
jgi:NAD(P)H-nitrite reductase large subunit